MTIRRIHKKTFTITQLAASENISSDILQQALENSGLPASSQPNDAANKTSKTSVSIQDTATGIIKKHTVRKVKLSQFSEIMS